MIFPFIYYDLGAQHGISFDISCADDVVPHLLAVVSQEHFVALAIIGVDDNVTVESVRTAAILQSSEVI